ncbi:MAG: DUF4837 family protein [Calditrichaeota bacterium]|nr:DUF4837 family protein [Calditrichota bacterium]
MVILILSCNTKPESTGLEGSVLFIVDELDRPIVRSTFEEAFGTLIHTPQPETQFTMYWEDGATLAEKTRAPLIVFAADLSGTGPTVKLLKSMLTEDVMKGVNEGDFVIFKRNNPWAQPQLLLILVGRNKKELGVNVDEWSDSLLKWSYDFEIQRITNMLYEKKEQKSLSDDLSGKYGFSVRIQHDYIVSQENDSLNYLRLIRHYPERWLTIAWGDMQDEAMFDTEFILNYRKKIGNSFLDPVMVYDEKYSSIQSSISGMDAKLVRGLWATQDPTGGGPFFSYGYFDQNQSRFYLIDGAVFAPGEQKVSYIWQLDAMANTFKKIN